MHRLSAWVGSLLGQPRRLLIVLGTCALVLAGASPFLWAGYHWYAGRAALQRYHNAEALRHLDACLQVWPWSRSVGVHLLAARAARRAGDFPGAFERLQQVQSTLGDQSPETLLEWSLLHAAGGDFEDVEGYLLDQLSQDSPHLLLILEALSEGYQLMGRSADALRSVDEWLARDPDNVRALFLRSNINRQSGSWPKAAPDLRRVVELDPELGQARWWLAVALLNIGRYDEAVGHLEILRQRQPDDVDVLVRLAMCRHRQGRVREAHALLDEVLAQRPNHGLALLTRGQIAQGNGQLPEAEKWLRQAADALPYDYKAHWSLTQCLRQQGKTEQAEAEEAYANQLRDRWARFSEITIHQISQRRNDPALYCEAAKLLFELGNPEGGKNWLCSALLLDLHYVPALTALADYYEKQGDGATAEEYRRRAQQSAARQAQDETRKANPSAAAAGGEHGKVP
jgi:tetratricopeptide (TPR) repeat protein